METPITRAEFEALRQRVKALELRYGSMEELERYETDNKHVQRLFWNERIGAYCEIGDKSGSCISHC